MANVTLFVGNRGGGGTTGLAQFYGAQTATQFEVINSAGVLIYVAVGTGFTYDFDGFFDGGTVTSEYYFNGSGQLTTQILNLNVDVFTRNDLLQVGTSSYDYEQYAFRGADIFVGSSEADLFIGSRGADKFDGNGGIDLLSFNGFESAVNVNLTTNQANAGFGVITLSEIEDIAGSAFGDTLTGNALANQIQGFAGADAINGGGGLDTVVYLDATSAVNVNLTTGVVSGGAGADTLVSIERVIGSRFNDTLTGSANADFFLGGFGNDTINGAGGSDTVEYGFVGSGVVVNLATGNVTGGAGADVLTSIESVIGSIFNDKILGSGVANKLNGGGGNDVLNGAGGNDVLIGGAGNDIFIFNTAPSATNRDTISDFSAVSDTIQLENAVFTQVGANGVLAAGAFFQGAAANDAGDRIIYNPATGALLYDADGNLGGAAVQFATLQTGLTLTNADFVII